MTNAREKDNLIYELGLLLCPWEELVRAESPTQSDYQVVAAKLSAEYRKWIEFARLFCTVNGVEFAHQVKAMNVELHKQAANLANGLTDPQAAHHRASTNLAQCKTAIMRQLDQIPLVWSDLVLKAGEPFTAHMHIRAAIHSARRRIHCCDRFMWPGFFHQYLPDVDRGLEIRIVTLGSRMEDIADVSELVAGEFTNYKLIVCSKKQFHDRHLRVDEQVFMLGASFKEAGNKNYPTSLTPVDGPGFHEMMDDLIAAGSVRHPTT